MTYTPTAETVTETTTAKRMMADIDLDKQTVCYGGVTYAATEIPAGRATIWCVLKGLSLRIQSAKDPAAAFADLVAGKTPADRNKAVEKVDPWTQAIAAQIADERAEADGVKRFKPGGRAPTEEFAAILADAEKIAAGLSSEKRRALRKLPGVVAHHARITGSGGSALAELGV